MSETVIVANGQIDVHYTVSSLEHVVQLRCTITNPTAGSGFLIQSVATGSIPWTDGVDRFVELAKAKYPAGASFTNAVLQLYDGGVYIQKDFYSLGVAGTSGAAAFLAGSTMFTFKDAANKTVKVSLLETVDIPAGHFPYSSLGGAALALVDSFLDTSSGELGEWFVGRSDSVMNRFLFATVSINKKLQRKRNLG